MTRSRVAVPNGTLAVTRRTNERKLFWTPARPEVHQGYLYALAMAQEKQGLLVHHGVLMSDHSHVSLTPTEATDIGAAFRMLHRESARFLQEDLLARGYDAPRQIWDGRSTHAMHLVDAGAQIESILYQHLNVVTAGLVARADDWPGWLSPLSLLRGGTVVVDKPPVYFGKRQPAQRELVFSPPPELARLYGAELEGLRYWLDKAVRATERALARERTGDVIGPERLRRIHPFAEPATVRERRGQPIPRFKVGRGWRDLRDTLREEDARFLGEAADARERWIGGEHDAQFPYGTLQMVAEYGADMADPHEDAILCAADRAHLYDVAPYSVRDAVQIASGAVLDELDGDERPGAARDDDDVTDIEVTDLVETRPLESPTASAARPHPRRLIILRTRRRPRRRPRRGPAGPAPDT